MSKELLYSDKARKKVFAGISKVASAVKVTMGPKGRNVMIGRSYGSPKVTNDGVSVAEEIELSDIVENMGASLVKEAAAKTNDEAGDGTTSTVVLVEAIAKEGLSYVTRKNKLFSLLGVVPMQVNPFSLGRGFQKALVETNKILRSMSTSISLDNKDELRQIATISAQDEEVGDIIAEVMHEVGKDGLITVEEGKTNGVEKDTVKGMQFNNGYLSPQFITDLTKNEASITNPDIIITDKKIAMFKDILPLLELLAREGRKDLIIIADQFDRQALDTIVINKTVGKLNVIAINAPDAGSRRAEALKDIAAVTGATVISSENGLTFEKADLSVVGKADKVTSTKDRTTIIGGKGSPEAIESRLQSIEAELADNTGGQFEESKLKQRRARLVGGISVLRVGAATETEMKNKKDKIEDALNATRAAVEEGIVAGGGSAFVKISKMLELFQVEDNDEQIGIDIVRKAILYPAMQIANNAGYDGDMVIEQLQLRGRTRENIGFDAKTGTFKNMIRAGIIDPVKVLRTSLENAVSAASMLLTTDASITVSSDEKANQQMPGM